MPDAFPSLLRILSPCFVTVFDHKCFYRIIWPCCEESRVMLLKKQVIGHKITIRRWIHVEHSWYSIVFVFLPSSSLSIHLFFHNPCSQSLKYYIHTKNKSKMYSILKSMYVSKHVGLIVWPFKIGKPPDQYCGSMQCLVLKVSNDPCISLLTALTFIQVTVENIGCYCFCVQEFYLFYWRWLRAWPSPSHLRREKCKQETFEYGSILQFFRWFKPFLPPL